MAAKIKNNKHFGNFNCVKSFFSFLTKFRQASLFSFFLIFALSSLPISHIQAQNKLWTLGTAKTNVHKELTVSFFSPTRYGITNSLEIYSHIFALPVLPNAGIKKAWYLSSNNWLFSSNHALYYTTPSLKQYNNYVTAPYLPFDSVIPNLISVKNEIIASRILKKNTFCEPANYLLSLRIGNISAIRLNDTTSQTITEPLLYRNTAVFDENSLWYAGIDLEAWYNTTVNYSVDLDFYILSPSFKYWSVENKIILSIKLSEHLNIYGGIKNVLDYKPTGYNYAVFPIIEMSYNLKFKKDKLEEKSLFEESVYKKTKKKRNKKKKEA